MDIEAGRLRQVADVSRETAPDYYLVRKRTSSYPSAGQAVWAWCAAELAFPKVAP
jgi:hypothetical protein